jgi:hypothetical protein
MLIKLYELLEFRLTKPIRVTCNCVRVIRVIRVVKVIRAIRVISVIRVTEARMALWVTRRIR